MEKAYKFGNLDPADREWFYENVWSTEETTGGGGRLVIAPSQAHVDVLIALLEKMTGPFWVLYVLVVSRGQAGQGRYQVSEPQAASAVGAFLGQFRDFLQGDGRHNLWIASESGSEMLIYDRHNVIYAYGPLQSFSRALAGNGFIEVSDVRFPSPHSHHYHHNLDAEEHRLMQYWNWNHSPLKASDEE